MLPLFKIQLQNSHIDKKLNIVLLLISRESDATTFGVPIPWRVIPVRKQGIRDIDKMDRLLRLHIKRKTIKLNFHKQVCWSGNPSRCVTKGGSDSKSSKP